MNPKLALLPPLFACLLGCSESADSGKTSETGGSGTGGSGGTASGSGGTASGAAGAGGTDTAGQGGTGQGGVSGGASGASGAAGVGGSTDAGRGGTSPGGSSSTGGSGGVGGSSGAAGSGGAAACTRALLSSTTDAYFTALAAHDSSGLPLASGVKFTENGQVMDLGEEGLWLTAGALVYKHTALDTEACSAMSQAVVPDGGMNIPFALRLKLVSGRITDIETIAVRAGDYSLGASNTQALAASGDSVGWDDPVPSADRNTREEIVAWMNKYFRMFPAGVCNTTSACRRIENGGGNFMCLAGASCSANQPGPNDDELVPRLILADVETGLGVGFTMFQGNTDMHMFKMFGDQVHGVSAVLGQAGGPGW